MAEFYSSVLEIQPRVWYTRGCQYGYGNGPPRKKKKKERMKDAGERAISPAEAGGDQSR